MECCLTYIISKLDNAKLPVEKYQSCKRVQFQIIEYLTQKLYQYVNLYLKCHFKKICFMYVLL